MNLADLQQHIADHIKAKLPNLKTCEPHPGRFDANELKRISAKAPAVFVACLTIGDTEQNQGIEAPTSWAAYIVTRTSASASREDQALNLAQALTLIISESDLGIPNAIEETSNINGRNLYSGAIDKTGVNMWAITWRQKISLGEVADLAALDDFLRAAGEANNQTQTLIETQQQLPGANP